MSPETYISGANLVKQMRYKKYLGIFYLNLVTLDAFMDLELYVKRKGCKHFCQHQIGKCISFIGFPICPYTLFTKFKFLRILSLSHYSNFEFKELPDSVGNLEHLRSLDLSWTKIKKLSESICSLSHLQILKLNCCMDLEELPSNLHLITTLCRLEFTFTKVRKVPPGLEELKNLKVRMDIFKVDHSMESGIQRLGKLNNLHESLSIQGLQDIENPRDALKPDLLNKTHLLRLALEWERTGNSIDSKKEENVIENLKPPKNLKGLSIFNYGGKQLPNWLLENSLWNMVSLLGKLKCG